MFECHPLDKSHHELLTLPDHVNLCTRAWFCFAMTMSSSLTEDAYMRTAYEKLMKHKTN